MSTSIITGFSLGSSEPIDARIVASGSMARDAIQYKYDGLRVYDTFDHIPYVWIGSTYSGTWSSENISGISGSGSSGYLPIFTSANVVANSGIYKTDSYYGINNTNPTYSLDVSGDIRASGNLRGSGQYITDINPAQLSSRVGLEKMPIGLTGSILTTQVVGGFLSAEYRLPSQISGINQANNATNVYITSDQLGTASVNYLTFVSGAGYVGLKSSSNLPHTYNN